jgi:AraC-like DNA-binding protein
LLTEELGRLDKSDVVARCRAGVLEHLESGEISEVEMAKTLHMSPRTLQRKLADAETTYLKLVDDTRRDLALRFVEDPHRSITDITFTLGFSQQSAFARAFKRWTGRSPTEYRAKSAKTPVG